MQYDTEHSHDKICFDLPHKEIDRDIAVLSTGP